MKTADQQSLCGIAAWPREVQSVGQFATPREWSSTGGGFFIQVWQDVAVEGKYNGTRWSEPVKCNFISTAIFMDS
jgi:hypothetical protein